MFSLILMVQWAKNATHHYGLLKQPVSSWNHPKVDHHAGSESHHWAWSICSMKPIHSLKLTASSPLKNGSWKTILSYYYWENRLVFREGRFQSDSTFNTHTHTTDTKTKTSGAQKTIIRISQVGCLRFHLQSWRGLVHYRLMAYLQKLCHLLYLMFEKVKLPSRKLTYPILGKGTSSSKVPLLGPGRGYVSSLEGK